MQIQTQIQIKVGQKNKNKTNKSENTNTHDYQLVDRRMYEAGVGSPVVVGGQLFLKTGWLDTWYCDALCFS